MILDNHPFDSLSAIGEAQLSLDHGHRPAARNAASALAYGWPYWDVPANVKVGHRAGLMRLNPPSQVFPPECWLLCGGDPGDNFVISIGDGRDKLKYSYELPVFAGAIRFVADPQGVVDRFSKDEKTTDLWVAAHVVMSENVKPVRLQFCIGYRP